MKFLSTSNSPTEKENLKCLTRKHIAERQRRARINFLLEQLETLILPQDSEPSPVKLEKAEVLEKTVDYIQKRRSSDLHGSRAEYEKGYKECLQKVYNFIDGSTLAPLQKNNIRASLLSQQVSSEQPMEMPLSESTSQQRHHRLPRQYAVGNLCAPVQYIKQEAEVVRCQSNTLDTVSQYQMQVSQEHITMSPVHLQISPVSYPLPNNQLPVSHFQLPVSEKYEGLLSTTTGRHMQIMNTGATQFCEQSGSGITDANVWRPW
ncbi:hairy/enhancer-of-split related with YRPW motif protein 2-like [Mizuhopecten yessoensis]|uniref:Transcription factor HES-7.1-B n=1 Tax=Mizuhopecten yessoensis TaxID=6573 RepID=A0A210Q3Z5_MIZYE|nr:hairy/enhancer-of-split related with YRPW motif protein 2-like [Mizuhopecten yessoensis]OWF43432.1 Transcription factor HES-7.1-B [Mizuhopecten yessoensis]